MRAEMRRNFLEISDHFEIPATHICVVQDMLLGKIVLEDIVAEKLKGKKTTFSLYAPNSAYKIDNNQLARTYYVLATDTEEECDGWVSSLRKYSYKTSKNKALAGSNSAGNSGGWLAPSSPTGVAGEDHDSKKQQKKMEKKRQDERKVCAPMDQ